ncbi:Nif3-like dinuclear metal center hexameric protein, partial [bacterium]|nr:Nif3-like dinuclear metal center hexameric protein [bacterium]
MVRVHYRPEIKIFEAHWEVKGALFLLLNMKLQEFIKEFELRYPPQWAMESDKVGLFCGDLNRGVEKILIALDPSKNVLEEAASGGYDLLLTHHPVYRSDFENIT